MKEFNNDKDLFNDSLRGKFNEAEYKPSSSVWEGIEGELLKQDNVKIQRKAVFYRNVAAAVLLVAMVSIYFNIQGVDFNSQKSQNEQLDISGSVVELEQNSIAGAEVKRPGLTKPSQKLADDEPQNHTTNSLLSNEKNLSEKIASSKGSSDNKDDLFNSAAESINSGNTTSAIAIIEAEQESREGLHHNTDENYTVIAFNQNHQTLDRMNSLSPSITEDNKISLADVQINEVSYFAVSNLDQAKSGLNLAFQSAFNVGSGSFNPNTNITSGPSQSSFSSLNTPGNSGRSLDGEEALQYKAQKELVESVSSAPIKSNISMTFGIHAGLKINDRLAVRSGLQYGNYRSSSQSSAVVRDANNVELFPYHGASSSTELSDGKIINLISEYDLYNDFQILSVPLLISYKFIDRKFGVALVGGASADFILKNTIRGGSDQISDVTFEQNDQKSYRNTFYSGMAGIEFSYSFAKNYAISLTPTYKKALSNITYDDARFSSSPDFISVDMSIQYIF